MATDPFRKNKNWLPPNGKAKAGEGEAELVILGHDEPPTPDTPPFEDETPEPGTEN